MGKSIRKIGWFCKILPAILLLAGCYRHHLYVQQEWVDKNFLASSRVGSPDPRQADPPEGQRLLVAWDFPRSLFRQELSLDITVRFWSDTEQKISYPMMKKRGYKALFFPKEKILTYRVDVVSKEGKTVETWMHHFWTKLIEVGDKSAEADSNSSSVSSQPMQESVIDTP